MNSFELQETELQQQLQEVCSKRGRELDLTKSAEIFNKLGLLYKTRSPDKIRLIQSSALLNAAIVRQPDNPKFQDDLHDLCKHVLRCANAKQHLANLVSIAKRVKIQIEKMRTEVRNSLQDIQNLLKKCEDTDQNTLERTYSDKIKIMQYTLSRDYKRVMAEVSQKCIQIMGTPPCEYTLVGMGSLARNEITPYSDFEHIILLDNVHQRTNSNENSHIKEYFRWYSVLFHIIVINLQETIIPNVAIACLNDTLTSGGDWFWDTYTTQGISFDSLKPLASKVPLGRTQKTPNKPWTTELIKPVDEMVKFLDEEEDLKNGYKLADILTRTCYVDGDEMIYNEFCQKVKSTLKHNQSNLLNVKKQLAEDLRNYDASDNFQMFAISQSTSINIKRIFYRSITLFVSALGRLHDIDKNSCFDIIDDIHRRHEINDVSANRLLHAVAVACHVRLFHYMSKNGQDDAIYRQEEPGTAVKLTNTIKTAVNIQWLPKCLATAKILQDVIKKGFAIAEIDDCWRKDYFRAQMYFFSALTFVDEGIAFGEQYLANQEYVTNFDILGCLRLCAMYLDVGQFDKSLDIIDVIKEEWQPNWDFKHDIEQFIIYIEVKCLLRLRKYSEIICKIDTLLDTDLNPQNLFLCLLTNAISKFELNKNRQALSAFRDVKKRVASEYLSTTEQAVIFLDVSLALIREGRIRQGLHVAREGLNFTTLNEESLDLHFIAIIKEHKHFNA